MKLIPKNWSKFQHYKDRCPPWIKFHRDLLNDRKFMCLPVASKALAPLLWLLASECKDGTFDADIDELVFRLRMPADDISNGLRALIDNGFFVDANTMLAPRYQDAIPETETETERETKAETEKHMPIAAKAARVSVSDEYFDRFWEAYDYKLSRHKALKAWQAIKPDAELAEKIIAAALIYNKANPGRAYYKHATTWLNGRNWEDNPNDLLPKIARMHEPAKTQHQLNQEAVARSLGLIPSGAMKTIQGEVIDATENTTRLLG